MIKKEKLLRFIFAVSVVGIFYSGVYFEISYPGLTEKSRTAWEYGKLLLLIYSGYIVLMPAIRKLIKLFLTRTLSPKGKVSKYTRIVSEVLATFLLWTFFLGIESQKRHPDTQLFSLERWGDCLIWASVISFLAYLLPSLIQRAINEEFPERGTVFIEIGEGKWKKIGRVKPIL